MANQRTDINERLTFLNASVPSGVMLTQKQIADFCGCSRENIQQIEKAGLKKLRRPEIRAMLTHQIDSDGIHAERSKQKLLKRCSSREISAGGWH